MRKYLAIAVAALMLATAAIADESKKAEAPKTATVDEKAPDFELTDAQGKVHKLSDYKGKYVVLEWVNFDCPFVRKHYGSKNMQSLQASYIKKGVIWLTICSSAKGKQGNFEGKALADRLSKEGLSANGYLVDANGAVGRMYGAKATPNMFVVNPEGTLIYAGAIDDIPSADPDDIKKATNYVSTALDAAMAGKPVPVKITAPYGCSVKY